MDDQHPEWLPADWNFSVSVRTSGKKDKYYINPQNGMKCKSKLEVLRYLKKAENDAELKKAENDVKLKKTENDVKLETKENAVELEKTVNDVKLKTTENTVELKKAEDDVKLKERNKTNDLPPGWIKEIKVTKRGGKTRRVTHYIDPVTGHHCRTMQEVDCYLKAKEAESKGDDSNPPEDFEDNSKSPTVVAEEQKSIDSKEDKKLAVNESITSVEKTNSVETNAVEQQREEKLAVNESITSVEKSNSVETNAVEQQREEKDSVGENQKQESGGTGNKRKNSNHNCMNGPRRTSKRLALKHADSLVQLETSNGAKEAEKAEVNSNGNTGKSDILTKQKEVTDVPVKNIASSIVAASPATLLDEAEISTITNTTSASKVNASGDFDKPKQLTKKDINMKEDDKNEKASLLDSSLPVILMDPCIEFAIKTLTGEIPFEDVLNKVPVTSPNQTSGSSSAPHIGDIWADPCFEFAVKTLTSEIPTEDGSRLRLSSSSGGINKIK